MILTNRSIPIYRREACKAGRLGGQIGTREHTDRLTQVQHQWSDSSVVYGPDVRFFCWNSLFVQSVTLAHWQLRRLRLKQGLAYSSPCIGSGTDRPADSAVILKCGESWASPGHSCCA